jgi:hypothetical protein
MTSVVGPWGAAVITQKPDLWADESPRTGDTGISGFPSSMLRKYRSCSPMTARYVHTLAFALSKFAGLRFQSLIYAWD